MGTDVESRLAALEARLQAAEDELAIFRLVASYGPAVDSATRPEVSRTAAALWTEDGVYDVGGMWAAEGRDAIAALFDGPRHQELVERGCAHVMGLPHIRVEGDRATAVTYSRIYRRAGEGYAVVRLSANRWDLQRTPAGWRIVNRVNRPIDGSEEPRAVLRSVHNI
jgi:hypothetical protein